MKVTNVIDFEREIELRLSQFRLLNGKGNVKDCNLILYEIIHLMLGMIQNNKALDDYGESEPLVSNNGCDPLPIQLEPVADAEPSETPIPTPPAQAVYAPLGLTRFGNPIRDRSHHAKRGASRAPATEDAS